MTAGLMTLIYSLYILINVIIAFIHRDIREKKLRAGDTTQLDHTFWAGIYAGLCGVSWLFFHDLYFIGAVLLQHVFVFAVVFNLLIGMPPFNLSRSSKSLFDRTLVRFGFKDMEVIDILALCASIGLLIKATIYG